MDKVFGGADDGGASARIESQLAAEKAETARQRREQEEKEQAERSARARGLRGSRSLLSGDFSGYSLGE